MDALKLIVGVGNPGKEYQLTRHNLGFLVIEKLAEKLKAKFQLSSFTKAMYAEVQRKEDKVGLLLPTTYVNRSGHAVKATIENKNVELLNALVVCDDLNLPFGQMRIKVKGSDGGHNGLVSIIESLESDQFPRLRLGIGQPKGKDEQIDFVLDKFTKEEQGNLEPFVEEAVNCCSLWLDEGIEKAMERYNQRPSSPNT